MTATMIASPLTPSIATVPVLPESAPFSSAQRAWLNGFFAGMVGNQATSSAAATVLEAPAAPQTEVEEDFPWHEPTLAIDERLKLAEGKPAERMMMAAMAQLDCGACGYLCKTYAEAIARDEEKDLTRCVPGGRDTAKALKQLVASSIVPVSQVRVKKAAAVADPQAPAAPKTWERNNPYPARLVEARQLNGAGSAKDTRLVVIDLRDSGISYKPGDALGVFPENCTSLVSELLEGLRLSGAEDVPGWDGDPISLREALTREFTITRPTPDLLDMLARCASDQQQRTALEAMRDSEDGAGDLQIVDLLRRFPSARPVAGDFVATLSPLAPRLYSISSALSAHPGRVHLTVGAVRYSNSLGRECGGVASTFLADRIRPGQTVRVFVHPSHKFGLPTGDKPVIMVGPGTGIAPFRSFLQERKATDAPGKNWLIFGDQRSDCDFLFREEMDAYQKDGVLTRLDTAFSRDQENKLYVQNRMVENGAELWQWLQQGAHFYVCGDAKRMAADVDKALRQIVTQHGNLSAAQADAYVAEMIRGGRYQRDVY